MFEQLLKREIDRHKYLASYEIANEALMSCFKEFKKSTLTIIQRLMEAST
jgi:hypothetical protein